MSRGLPAPDLGAQTRDLGELRASPPSRDVFAGYRQAGLFVATGDIPFVGSVGFLAGPTPDSTFATVAFSLPNRTLTFTREGERYRGAYDVVLELRRGDSIVRREVAHEDVRVSSFRETTRAEESVIFQQFALVGPGSLTVSIAVRDAGSTRAGATRVDVNVPRLDRGLMAPIAVFLARARASRRVRPTVVMSPRATSVFGRDSTAAFYLEAYGPRAPTADARAAIHVYDESSHVVFTDTVSLAGSSDSLFSAIVRVPLTRIGFGALRLAASEVGAQPAPASAGAPLLVTFGEGLGVASFTQMLGYLRFFSSPERLRALHDAAPAERPRAWAEFLTATDPSPGTPENEALRDYFARLTDANIRFQEETGPGWLTDRGMIFTALGEPDERREAGSGDPMQRNRVEVWEYQRYRSRFVFVDQTGYGRWRLTPGSEAEYHALLRRLSR